MSIRLDFIDFDDLSCRLAGCLTDFRAIHMGLKHHHQYLLPTRKGEVGWIPTPTAERFLRGKIVHSFELIPEDYYPLLVEMSGTGQELSPLWWRLLTEWPYYLRDAGFKLYRPPRTNCVSIVRGVMTSMNIPTQSETPRFLYHEMRRLALQDDSGVIECQPYPQTPKPHPSPLNMSNG